MLGNSTVVGVVTLQLLSPVKTQYHFSTGLTTLKLVRVLFSFIPSGLQSTAGIEKISS